MSVLPSGRVRTGIVWENMDDLNRVLEKTIPRDIKMVQDIAGIKTIEDAKERAKQNCPVDTGALRKSIRFEYKVRRARDVDFGIAAGGHVRNPKTGLLVNYAAYVEEIGTRFQRPQPFLRPALEWAVRNRLKKNVWRAMAKISG